MIELDGSLGEGGGQILRSSLALAVLTGKPFRLFNIRANRPKPGMAAQHFACVKAAAAICGGIYKGASIGSSVLVFEPSDVKSGPYHFQIGTAGATALVLHTVFLPLALRGDTASDVTISGGTHVAYAPCFHYLQTTWAAYLRGMGLDVELTMVQPGFYPRGGGEIRAIIRPCRRVNGLTLIDSPTLTTADGFSAIAGLPAGIGKRQAQQLTARLKRVEIETHIPTEQWANGPSSVIGVVFRQPTVPTSFFALGEKGKSAERVADDVADQAMAFRESGCPVDPHSADQILLPLAFSPDASEYRVSNVTKHLLTNIDVIRQFIDRDISCDCREGSTGVVRIAASGL